MFKKVSISVFLLIFLHNIVYSAESIKRFRKTLSKGIRYIKVESTMDRGPISYHVVKVNLDVPNVYIKPAFADNLITSKASVKEITKIHKAIVGINGSFFTTNSPCLPVGRIIINGKSVYKDDLYRSMFALSFGRKAFFNIPQLKDTLIINFNQNRKLYIWGINRPRKEDEITLYTPEYGESTLTNDFGDEVIIEDNKIVDIRHLKGNSIIPKNGYVLSFHGKNKINTNSLKTGMYIQVQTEPSLDALNIQHAVMGGPRLIKNGRIVVHPYFNIEQFSKNFHHPNARTAVGVNDIGEIIFIVVEKNNDSVGMTFTELAWLMKSMHITDAMALDGGSSSSIYVNDPKVTGNSNYYPLVNNAIIIGTN